jgi:hypothetical protein
VLKTLENVDLILANTGGLVPSVQNSVNGSAFSVDIGSLSAMILVLPGNNMPATKHPRYESKPYYHNCEGKVVRRSWIDKVLGRNM